MHHAGDDMQNLTNDAWVNRAVTLLETRGFVPENDERLRPDMALNRACGYDRRRFSDVVDWIDPERLVDFARIQGPYFRDDRAGAGRKRSGFALGLFVVFGFVAVMLLPSQNGLGYWLDGGAASPMFWLMVLGLLALGWTFRGRGGRSTLLPLTLGELAAMRSTPSASESGPRKSPA